MERPNVLVVDDEQVMRDFMVETLARSGYVVSEAEDGDQALHALDARPQDVVVTDLLMPNLTGLETCHELRRRYPGVGIVAVTGAQNADVYFLALRRLGVTIMLAKPFDEADLLQAVKQALGAP